jgi:hypothetical protein
MAVTVTKVVLETKIIGSDGLKRVQALLILAGTYVSATGIPVTADMFGLNRFKPTDLLTGLLDPIVKSFADGATGQNMIASIQSLILRLFYPTGGGGTNPTTPAAPHVSAGAVAVTADAATATIVPGIAKELANAGDVSNMSIVAIAEGY